MNYNFEVVYSHYLDYIKNRQKNQSIRTLKERFEKKIIPYFKEFDVNKINRLDYVNFQNEIEKYNYSNSYKKNLHYLMTNFFDYCIKYYNVDCNVAREVGQFKLNNIPIKHDFYNLSEFNLFINFVDKFLYRTFFEFMFFTGCRPGEAMALKFNDLSYRNISINKTIDEHGSRQISSPKTFTSNRTISIDKKLYKSILILKKYYINKYNTDINNLFIFGGLKPLSPTTINRYKIKACQKANLRPIKLHEFRHSHATLLLDKKIMINEISRRLGHSKVSTTLDIYTHTSLKQEKRVILTLDFLRFRF